MTKFIATLSVLMLKKGQVFICGTSRETNTEMAEIINRLSNAENQVKELLDFINEMQIEKISKNYSSHYCARLSNKI